MIDQSEIYNLSFEDFIEIDENLKYSEEEFGVRCFVEDTKEYRILCRYPKTGKVDLRSSIEESCKEI